MSAYATFFFEEDLASKTTNHFSNKIITIESTAQEQSLPPPQHTNDSFIDKNANGWYTNHANHLFISILSANVNPLHLIQSFTRHSSNASNTIRERITSISNSITGFHKPNAPNFSEDDDAWGEYSDKGMMLQGDDSSRHATKVDSFQTDKNPSIPSEPCLDMSTSRPSITNTTCDTLDSADPQEAAIEFNLSIAFNGRTYTATRALPSFVKLRKDLLDEYSQCRNRKDRKSAVSTVYRHHNITHQPLNDTRFISWKSTSTSHALSNNTDCHEHDDLQEEEELQQQDVVIPELPIGSSTTKSQGLEHGAMQMMGMVGNGFRGLQDAVFAYAPPMERWIRTVAALVPSSQALANFLWEPIDQVDQGVQSMKLQRVQTLNSIHEGCDDNDESEDDDAW